MTTGLNYISEPDGIGLCALTCKILALSTYESSTCHKQTIFR